jgi:N-glycosylase/DNA lyase
LKQDASHIYYKVTWPTPTPPSPDDTESLLQEYFNLRPKLSDLYEQWSNADANFKKRAVKFTGIRILKQDPWEALVGFICSSNNNIARISQMVNNLCLHYGPLLGEVDGSPIHDFPRPEALISPNFESDLRTLGFGYRAKYLAKTAMDVAKVKSTGWLESLQNMEENIGTDSKDLEVGGRPGYRKAHEELLTLQGVGPKVADCVCLMGLGWGEAVPVDTHVWQIAQRDYKFGRGKHKSLTKATYDAVGDHFRQLWGYEAGWAHSVLFAADLKTFAVRLTEKTEVEEENVVVKDEETKTRAVATNGRKTQTEILEEVTVKSEESNEQDVPTNKRKLKTETVIKEEVQDDTGISTKPAAKRVRITRRTDVKVEG